MGGYLTFEETIPLMGSADYKERFKAEYHQLAQRIIKLETMLDDWYWGRLDFKPTCPKNLLQNQLYAMKIYRNILQERAELENINLF